MTPYLLFDFDGTLADSRRLSIQIYNDLAERYQFRRITDHDIPQLHNMTIPERMRWMGVAMWVIPRLAIDVMRSYRQSLGTLEPCGDVGAILEQLHRSGYRMSIISSNHKDNIKDFLKKQGWLQWFEHVIGANQLFGKHQPIRKFMKQEKLNPAEVIYIGDEIRDIESCRKAGCRMCAVTWGFDSVQLLEKSGPDYLTQSTDELLELLQRLAGGGTQ